MEGWICTTAGTACGTKHLAGHNYVLGDQVVSDSDKVYEVTSPGTSEAYPPGAAPTGTGQHIPDGAVYWKYVGPLAIFKTFGAISA